MKNTESANNDVSMIIERLARIMRAAEHSTGLDPVQWQALRYLARCNRFSNSPKALGKYLVTTKGTVSQTVKILVKKELLEKHPRPHHGRSITLVLTEKGKTLLQNDPWKKISYRAQQFDHMTREALFEGLFDILHAEITDGAIHPFGVCNSCNFFCHLPPTQASTNKPHWCSLLETGLDKEDSAKICEEHERPDQAL